MTKKRGNGRDKRSFFEYVSDKLDLPSDLFSGECAIEIRGRTNVTVRGCRRILRYSKEEIRLAMSHFDVRVRGKHLDCSAYFAGAIRIDGEVEAVDFPPREKVEGQGK